MDQQDQPATAWSHTRAETYKRCPRRYYLCYVAAPRGRRRGAAPEDRAAFVLSRLTDLALALGAAVHARAREIAHAVLRGRRVPAPEELAMRTRAELNAQWKVALDLRAFVAAPERSAAFSEVFYERNPGPERLTLLRSRLRGCLDALAEDAVWDELRTLPRHAVRVVDRPLRWATPDGIYWAAPDLVYTRPDGEVVLVDWKTGRERGDGADRQLATYSWFARGLLALGADGGACSGRAVFLDERRDTVRIISPAESADAADRAGSELGLFKELEQRGPEAFPRTTLRFQCPLCPFWALCRSEVLPSR